MPKRAPSSSSAEEACRARAPSITRGGVWRMAARLLARGLASSQAASPTSRLQLRPASQAEACYALRQQGAPESSHRSQDEQCLGTHLTVFTCAQCRGLSSKFRADRLEQSSDAACLLVERERQLPDTQRLQAQRSGKRKQARVGCMP